MRGQFFSKEKNKLILSMSMSDFKAKYSGSAFGTIWAFVQPVVTLVLYWIVFEYGLKSKTADPKVPYILWLMSGMVPYLFLSDALNSTMNSFLEYSYLVKKVIFDISILPIVKLISSIVVHLAFIVLLFVVCGVYQFSPSLYTLQLIFYLILLIIYILSLAYFLSTVVVFFRDLSQIVNIIIQIGMWATPILWPVTNVGESSKWIFDINPVFYIIDGYRDAIIGTKVMFWEKPIGLIAYMVVVLFNILVSKSLYRKLRGQLAEVL